MVASPCPTCGQPTDQQRHLELPTPGWDTKQRCACGTEFVSRCELWKHQADVYIALLNEPWPYVANTCMLCGNGVPFELGLCHKDDLEQFRTRHWQQFHPDMTLPRDEP